jgi:endonuclease/exonuclease/phosphatase family metal-dependent hydrolase
MFKRLVQTKLPIRFIIFGILISLIASCSNVKNIRPEATTPNFQSTLTVMTFNIRHGCGREKWGDTSSAFFRGCDKKYDDIIAAIRSADPDVVGLQEVSNSQVSLIANALNMNYAYSSHNPQGSSPSSYGGWWGNAVLSKFKLVESKRIAIGGSGGRNRSMVSAIGLVNGMPIAFMSIHTDHRLSDNRSIKKILNHMDSLALPAILIGDFNMSPHTLRGYIVAAETDLIDSAGSPGYGEMGTWGSPSGRRIDYVFVQSKYFKVLDAALVSAEHQHASDHIAYYATVELK